MLPGTLSVFEYLHFNALLRLPPARWVGVAVLRRACLTLSRVYSRWCRPVRLLSLQQGLACALLRSPPTGAVGEDNLIVTYARVCCAARRYSQAQRDDRVWALVRRLGLTKVVHSFIGDAHVRGLSGGSTTKGSGCAELRCN